MKREAPTGATRLAAVIGSPVRHSLSPALHNAAFDALGLDWTYVALEVAPGDGALAVEAMRTLGIGGMSVTMPHKETVAAGADRRSQAVEALGAANCLRWDGDAIVAENTDGAGFVRSLGDVGFDPAGAACVVLGAGGAARSVVQALASAGAADIAVVNRTYERARQAVACAPDIARVGTFADVAASGLVVNSTPVGMGAEGGMALPVQVIDALTPSHLVADLIYHPAVTPLLQAASAKGAATVNGLGMLLHQAAIQFEMWTGLPAPIDAMRSAVDLGG
ncbi:MAG: shikimate dehydrogenase [Acidimicrobiales bacterium]|nr:shikimate dehydrogenase [Acidimicrobiales bacterium]